MKFCMATLKVYCVLTDLPLISNSDDTYKAKSKFVEDDYLYRGHILSIFSDKCKKISIK